MAIFLPVVFLEDEAGQLFADLAVTLAAAVCFSLVVAITVIPTASSQWLKQLSLRDPHARWWQKACILIMRLTDGPVRRASWISGLIGIPLFLTFLLLPKADYLPEGNRNFVFAFIQPPPGVNIDHLGFPTP